MLKTALAAVLLAATLPAQAASDGTARSIIALERAALDRSDKGDGRGFLEISADDVVYQDPSLEKPIVGLKAQAANYAKFDEGGNPAEPAKGEMRAPQVQVYGDIAILSFHYTVHRHEAVVREWNCTEVYRKNGADWRIVNTHWSLTLPPDAKLD